MPPRFRGFLAAITGISNDVADASNILVLLVTRRTSGVGRRMESVLARLQVRERDRVRVARLDADDRPDLVQRLGVQEIPSIVMFEDRKRFACLRGRTTLGDVERTLSERVQPEESRAQAG
jgi:thioredoxin-like negative regulator of GroEL